VALPPEVWALVAEHSGLVRAWRLTGVCKAAREGAREWLLRAHPAGADGVRRALWAQLRVMVYLGY
jgi:hypothetical protein